MPIVKGDTTAVVKPAETQANPTSRMVNDFHTNDDVDSNLNAHHHTLGIGRNKASPGTHTHTGKDSRKIATGAGLVLTGAKAGNVALTNLIAMMKNFVDFTDSTT